VLFNKKKSKVIKEAVLYISGKSWLGKTVLCIFGES
jgi:hypothetical protein